MRSLPNVGLPISGRCATTPPWILALWATEHHTRMLFGLNVKGKIPGQFCLLSNRDFYSSLFLKLCNFFINFIIIILQKLWTYYVGEVKSTKSHSFTGNLLLKIIFEFLNRNKITCFYIFIMIISQCVRTIIPGYTTITRLLAIFILKRYKIR